MQYRAVCLKNHNKIMESCYEMARKDSLKAVFGVLVDQNSQNLVGAIILMLTNSEVNASPSIQKVVTMIASGLSIRAAGWQLHAQPRAAPTRAQTQLVIGQAIDPARKYNIRWSDANVVKIFVFVSLCNSSLNTEEFPHLG